MNDLAPPQHAVGPEKSVLSSMPTDPVEFIPRAIKAGITPERFYIPSHTRLCRILYD